ncbi:hypothetical protein LOK49_LG12G00906 [Camellia lanceoleosa]|uniref:Uncharacterized protein n=1 Tax=Camellia lanceoleosa TaxID=1840588 RepID=A0ACC0FUF5_9ERIC|nr:hypothetical protein LOK49_LG12G00906 [Camellia lanceoleosa]
MLISYSQEIVDGEPIYVSSNCLPIKACKFEPAGHSFHTAALRLSGFFEEEDADGGANVSNDKEYVPSSSHIALKVKKSGLEGKQQDHYAFFGLEPFKVDGKAKFKATDKARKEDYARIVLLLTMPIKETLESRKERRRKRPRSERKKEAKYPAKKLRGERGNQDYQERDARRRKRKDVFLKSL